MLVEIGEFSVRRCFPCGVRVASAANHLGVEKWEGIPAIAALGSLAFHPDVTFLAGENGSGKSTILGSAARTTGEVSLER